MQIKTAPLGDMGANFYAVEENGEIFVVDPGDEPEIAAEIIKDMQGSLKYIILTHAHFDHISGLDGLKKMFDVPVVMMSSEADALNDDSLNLSSAVGLKSPETSCDIKVNQDDTLPFGDSILHFIHTPGHTKGSMCVSFKDALFTGDTIFRLSVGRCDFPGGSFAELEDSIKNKIYTFADNTKLYPGHGEPTTVLYEKTNNPYFRG